MAALMKIENGSSVADKGDLDRAVCDPTQLENCGKHRAYLQAEDVSCQRHPTP